PSPRGRRCCRDWRDPRSPGSPLRGPWDQNDKCHNRVSRFAKRNAGQTFPVGRRSKRPNSPPALLPRASEPHLQLPRQGRPVLGFKPSLPPTCKKSHCQDKYNALQTFASKGCKFCFRLSLILQILLQAIGETSPGTLR